MEGKKVFGFSQHGFLKEKCLINWVVFYNEITCLVAEGRAADVAYCSFSKTFDAVFHKILIAEVWARQAGGEVDRTLELECRAPRIVISHQ